MKAIWKDTIIAESNDTVIVDGNHYFPPDAVNMAYMLPSDTQTGCPWKGTASYYSVRVGNDTNEDAAWYYPEPSDAAKNIKGRIAFWRGVKVSE